MKKIPALMMLFALTFVCEASESCCGRDDTLTFTVGGVSFVMVGVGGGRNPSLRISIIGFRLAMSR